eukprot:71408_1
MTKQMVSGDIAFVVCGILLICLWMKLKNIVLVNWITLKETLRASIVSEHSIISGISKPHGWVHIQHDKQPKLWCVYGQQDRTNNLMERSNKEMHKAITKRPLFWDFVKYVGQKLTDATIEFRRKLKHGRYPLKPLKQQRRDTALSKQMISWKKGMDKQRYISIIGQTCRGTMEDFESNILDAQMRELLEETEEEEKQHDDDTSNTGNTNTGAKRGKKRQRDENTNSCAPPKKKRKKNDTKNKKIKCYESDLMCQVQADVMESNNVKRLISEIKESPIWNDEVKSKYGDSIEISDLKSNVKKYKGSMQSIQNGVIFVAYVDGNRRYFKPGVVVLCEDKASLVAYPNEDDWVVISDFVKSIKNGDISIP